MPARPLLEDHSSPAPAIAITIPVRLIGLVLLALVAVVMVSLASWNVDDPSFSYASGEAATNWLGFPGAVIADNPGTRPGEDLNPALLAQLDNIDGVKDPEADEDE